MTRNFIKIVLLLFVYSTILSCKGQEKTEPKLTEEKTSVLGKVVSEIDNSIWVIFQDSKDKYESY